MERGRKNRRAFDEKRIGESERNVIAYMKEKISIKEENKGIKERERLRKIKGYFNDILTRVWIPKREKDINNTYYLFALSL